MAFPNITPPSPNEVLAKKLLMDRDLKYRWRAVQEDERQEFLKGSQIQSTQRGDEAVYRIEIPGADSQAVQAVLLMAERLRDYADEKLGVTDGVMITGQGGDKRITVYERILGGLRAELRQDRQPDR